MTSEWKEQVRARLGDTGETHAAIEKRIRCGRGQIAKMLRDDQTSSVWVRKVSEALRLPMPGEESGDEALLLRNFKLLTPERRRALLELASAAVAGGSKTLN